MIVQTEYGTVAFTHVWWFAVKDEDGNIVPDGDGKPVLFPPLDPIGDDAEDLAASRDTVLEIADRIVPGHGSEFPDPFDPDAVCAFGEVDDDDDD